MRGTFGSLPEGSRALIGIPDDPDEISGYHRGSLRITHTSAIESWFKIPISLWSQSFSLEAPNCIVGLDKDYSSLRAFVLFRETLQVMRTSHKTFFKQKSCRIHCYRGVGEDGEEFLELTYFFRKHPTASSRRGCYFTVTISPKDRHSLALKDWSRLMPCLLYHSLALYLFKMYDSYTFYEENLGALNTKGDSVTVSKYSPSRDLSLRLHTFFGKEIRG